MSSLPDPGPEVVQMTRTLVFAALIASFILYTGCVYYEEWGDYPPDERYRVRRPPPPGEPLPRDDQLARDDGRAESTDPAEDFVPLPNAEIAPREALGPAVTPPPTASAPAHSGPPEGCWVKIFEEQYFDETEDSDVLYGPARIGRLLFIPGAKKWNWIRDIESIIVGPHARVTLWSDDNFEERYIVLEPGTRLGSLKHLDFHNRAESIRIEYVP